MNWLLVFLGGGLGSLVRFGIGAFMEKQSSHFPLGTFVANALSCILLGLLMAMLLQNEENNPSWKYLWMIGFCGGFSTFSTFTGETFRLLQDGEAVLALLNVLVSVLVCLVCFYVGYKIVPTS